MKLIIKCPKCSKTFEISEQCHNSPACKCGWTFDIQNHIYNCLCVEIEEIDEEIQKKYTSLEAEAAGTVRTPYFVKTWLESRFATIPQETVASFLALMKTLDFEKRKKLASFKGFISKVPLGSVNVFNKKISVYIGNFQSAHYQYH
jgi:hypothetical protein